MFWSLQVPEGLKSSVLRTWASWNTFEKGRNLTAAVLFHRCQSGCHPAALGWTSEPPCVQHRAARGYGLLLSSGQGAALGGTRAGFMSSRFMSPTKLIIWYLFCPQSLARGWFLISGYQHFGLQGLNLQEEILEVMDPISVLLRNPFSSLADYNTHLKSNFGLFQYPKGCSKKLTSLFALCA